MGLNHIHTQRLLAFITSIIIALISIFLIQLTSEATHLLFTVPFICYLIAFALFGTEEDISPTKRRS